MILRVKLADPLCFRVKISARCQDIRSTYINEVITREEHFLNELRSHILTTSTYNSVHKKILDAFNDLKASIICTQLVATLYLISTIFILCIVLSDVERQINSLPFEVLHHVLLRFQEKRCHSSVLISIRSIHDLILITKKDFSMEK